MSLTLSPSPEQLREQFFALGSARDVAALLDVDYSLLVYHLFKVPADKKYTVFSVPKRSGGSRSISAPATALKILQKKLNQVLQSVYQPKPSVHGFVRERSIATNASRHTRKRYVFNVDLRDFFPSINFGRVRGMFMAVPYQLDPAVATVLAQISCFESGLPQGAPTSPVISNMICAKMDSQLQRLAQRCRWYYTRYADDITFSTSMPSLASALARTDAAGRLEVGLELRQIIEENGFRINPKKVRLRTKHRRQEVTGLTTNEKVNVRRKYVRQIRAMLHAWSKFGLEAAQERFVSHYDTKHRGPGKEPPSFALVVKGRIEFLGMIRGKDDYVYRRFLRQLRRLAPGLVPGPIDELDVLLGIFDDLEESQDRQRRGYVLQDLLTQTFDLHKIDVVESFTRNEGAEQIDGAFLLEGWHYIVECRWRGEEADPAQLDALRGKVGRSGKQTMGFFLSINGWSDNVPRILKQNPEKNIMLMDGRDLRCVLAGMFSLEDLVRAKVAALNLKSEPFYGAEQYLKEQA